MPVIGMRLSVMPTFSKTCVNQLASRPNATRLLNESFARSEIRITRRNKKQEQRERHGDADEPELLADDGEDEVGVLLRQKRESLLRAVADSPGRTIRRSRSPPATESRGSRCRADRSIGSRNTRSRFCRYGLRCSQSSGADDAHHDVRRDDEQAFAEERLVPQHEREQQQEPGAPDRASRTRA